MYPGKVEICGVNTSTLKVMKEKEKQELLIKCKFGDNSAREKLINGNIKLVLSVIQRFMSRGEAPDDLFQVGCIGLIKAIDGFDNTRGVRFSTYAVPMIIGEVRRYLRDNNSVRVSRSMRDIAYKAMQTKERLIRELLREPTIGELSSAMEMPKESVVLALEAIVEPISLSEAVYTDGNDTVYVMDQIGDTVDEKDWIDEMQIKDNLKALGERESKILYLRYMKGMTQIQVAKLIGISQAQVSRLEKNAMSAIKK